MLTQQQQEERNQGLGGSDSTRIMRGEWLDLWKEKLGLKEPVDLSDKLNVQIGIATESVNLDWLEKELDVKIIRDVTVDTNNFIMSHLDGMTADMKVPVEAKHTYEGNRMDVVAETNYAQLQHYMMHTGKTHMYLSVIFGNSRWEHTIIDADYTYQQKLSKVLLYFWNCVQSKTEPMSLDLPQAPAKEDIKLSGMVKKNMSNNLKWTDSVQMFKSTKAYVDEHNKAKKAIKAMMPDDCYEAKGQGVVVTRNKKNILTLREVANDE